MQANDYLGRSRLFRRLKTGPYGQHVEHLATRLVDEGYARKSTRRYLSVISGLLGWLARRRYEFTDLDENMVERYLRCRARRQIIQPVDRAILRRWLSVLRDEGAIARIAPPKLTVHDQILQEFEDYLRAERGLGSGSIAHHRPIVRRFLQEIHTAGTEDFGKINQQTVIRYVECHVRDYSPDTGKMMCSSLRAFLRYLHHRGLIPLALAGCVPSVRRWKLATLPAYLSAAQVTQALDSCDRATALGRRNYAILIILARLGLRASEVATLTLDDIDWRAGEMHIRAKGRQRARIPMPPDVGAAIVAYLRNGRPKSSCRRLFVRMSAPHVGFASGTTITGIAKTALDRAGIKGCVHRGAHVFRHSLATELLRAGASLSEIGQLLRHRSHDTTRIYAKVDIEALRTLDRPWPGGSR
jgi:site-specific recombinase XerD